MSPLILDINYSFRINIDDMLLAVLSVLIVWKQSQVIIWGNPNVPPPFIAYFHFPFWLMPDKQAVRRDSLLTSFAYHSLFMPSLIQAPAITYFAVCAGSVKPQNEETGSALLLSFTETWAKKERSSESPVTHAHDSMSRGFHKAYLNIEYRIAQTQCGGS